MKQYLQWVSRLLVSVAVVVVLFQAQALPTQAAVLKLSGVIPDTADVGSFQLSPAGNRIVYRVDSTDRSVAGYYSALPTGGTPIKLTPNIEANVCCPIFDEYAVSPNGSRVVYRIWNVSQNQAVPGLWSVPIDGSSAPVRISTDVSGYDFQLAVTADSRYVVYRSSATGNPIYSVPIDGSAAPVRLSPIPVAGGGTSRAFRLSPDGRYVVYRGDLQADEVYDLYSTPVTGPDSATMRLNPTLPAGGDVGDPAQSPPPDSIDFSISLDGQRVVYIADQEVSDEIELYSVPIVGPASASVRLSVPQPAGFTVQYPQFQFSADGANVVYLDRVSGGEAEPATRELWSVPISGPASASVRLNGPFQPGGEVTDYAVAGGRAIYTARDVDNGPVRLFSAAVSGPAGTAIPLSAGLVDRFAVAPDGNRVIFRDFSMFGIWSISSTGPITSAVQMESTAVSWPLLEVMFTPDSQTVIYRGLPISGSLSTTEALWAVPVVGPGNRVVKLTGPMVPSGRINEFVVTSDGRYVVYTADREIRNKRELFIADISGFYVFVPFVRR